MSLYKAWTDMVVDYVKHEGEAAFWREYGSIEKRIYSNILASGNKTVKGTVAELAATYETTKEFFMGFVDGINDSLHTPYDLEALTETTEMEFKIDFEKLYFNMLDARADYLYNLPQWEGIFSVEKRKEIQKAWRASKVVINEAKVGRNDPCTCGSGKKYKKCCGREE
jgi:preprotein translocase subunit SecA